MRFLTVIFFFCLPTLLTAAQYRAVLEPVRQTVLSAEIESVVMKIHKRMGEEFKVGEDLVTLKSSVFEANVQKGEALVAKAKSDLEAKEALFRDRTATLSELREAEAAFAIAKAELILAKDGLEACFIRAPYDGKVVQIFVKAYERVQDGQEMIEILDDSSLIAKLLLPQGLFGSTSVGNQIELVIKENGKAYNATIVRKGAVIDPVSSLFKVDAEIENSDRSLHTGMEALFIIPDSE